MTGKQEELALFVDGQGRELLAVLDPEIAARLRAGDHVDGLAEKIRRELESVGVEPPTEGGARAVEPDGALTPPGSGDAAS